MINTIFESGIYRLDADTLYGVCWYVRKKDDHVTLLNTGIEAEEEIAWAKELDQNSKHDCSTFNSIAAEHSFSPRWEKVT
jgi:hypothetical protein